MALDIKIHNESLETIALIPFSRHDKEKLHAKYQVRSDLAIDIPKNGYETVNCEKYNLSGEVHGAQIHMLFRAGKCPNDVKPRVDEKVFLYTGLAAKPEWHLRLEVKGGPDNAVVPTSSGANAASPQDARLGELKEKVQKLEKEVKGLPEKIKALKNELAQHSTNTPSLSK